MSSQSITKLDHRSIELGDHTHPTFPRICSLPSFVSWRSIRTAARGLFSKHGVKVEPQDFPDPALMPAAIAGGHQEREHERRQC